MTTATVTSTEPIARNRRPYDSVLDTIGWTPLIRLNRVARGIRTPVYGKAEFFNPGGSVKDRIGMPIIEAAERSGALKPGGTIVEGTSGNTGVGARDRGGDARLPLHLHDARQDVAGEGAAAEGVRRGGHHHADRGAARPSRQLRHDGEADRGADAERDPREPVLQPGEPRGALRDDGPRAVGADRGAHHALRRRGRHGRDDHRRRALPQGAEPEHPDHRRRSRRGRSSRSCGAGSATASTASGRWARRTRSRGSARTSCRARSTSVWSTTFQTVSDRDAFAMARRLTREEGLFVGGSAGLIAHVALQVARAVDDPDACVVTLLCDTGERYLSKLYNDEWMRENQLLEPDRATLGHLLAQARRRRAGAREHGARRARAAGARPHAAARRVAAPRDGRRPVRRQRHRVSPHDARSREHAASSTRRWAR